MEEGMSSGEQGGSARADRSAADPLIGRRIDRYHILSRLGSGGFSTVYRAHDQRLGRDVALKSIPNTVNPTYMKMFLREKETLAQLGSHKGILQVLDIGETDTFYYLVLDLVDTSAAALLQTSPRGLPIGEALRIAAECAEALEYAHKARIFHRDIKPENILIDLKADGHACLADFGLAHIQQPDHATVSRIEVGTPWYMPPEQLNERKIDHRSDIFSLGVTLHELLCGQKLFPGTSYVKVMDNIRADLRVPLRQIRREIPKTVLDIVDKATAKAPERRFQSAAEFAVALRQAMADVVKAPPPSQRPALTRGRKAVLVFATMVFVLAIGAAAALLWGFDTSFGPSAGNGGEKALPPPPPSQGTPGAEEVSVARLAVIQTRQAAALAGAEEYARDTFASAVSMFVKAETNDTLGHRSEACDGYVRAKGMFLEAEREGRRVSGEIAAWNKARSEASRAKSEADAVQASSWAPGKYGDALKDAQGADATVNRVEATKAFESATALYGLALKETLQQAYPILEPERTRADQARQSSDTEAVRIRAPQELQAALARWESAQVQSRRGSYREAKAEFALAAQAFDAATQKAVESPAVAAEGVKTAVAALPVSTPPPAPAVSLAPVTTATVTVAANAPPKKKAARGAKTEKVSPQIQQLASQLEDKDSDTRREASDELVKAGAPAVPVMLASLASPQQTVRQSAADVLARIGSPAVSALGTAAAGADPKVQLEAVRILGRIKDGASSDSLIAALADRNEQVRQAACASLGQVGNERAVDALTAKLSDRYAYVRDQAVRALGRIGSRRAVPALINAVKDDNPTVRCEAAKALGSLGDARAIPVLQAAANDDDPYVRDAVQNALRKLK